MRKVNAYAPQKVTAHAAETSCVVPGVMYTKAGLIRASGLSSTRLAALAAAGITPDWIRVGRRLYVEGDEAIRLIKRAAAYEAERASREAEAAIYGDD